MNTPNERFREVRKACGKTQEEWGTIIGITRAGVTDIEAGRRNVTDKHLVALKNYSEYPINIDWIKNGTGDMFKKRTRNQELLAFSNEIMGEMDESFKKRLILALSKLDERDWETLQKLAESLTKKED